MLKRCDYPNCNEFAIIIVANEVLINLCIKHDKIAQIIHNSNDYQAIHRFKKKIENERIKRNKSARS